MEKSLKKFYKFLTSEKVGRHSGKIALGTFALMFVGFYMLVQASSIQADAISVSEAGNEINEVRMTCIKEVYRFDDTVNEPTKNNIIEYLYSTVDEVELLGMINMREHVIFSANLDGYFINGTNLYVSTKIDLLELEKAKDELREETR